MSKIRHIFNREGEKVRFEPFKIRNAIGKALESIHLTDEGIGDSIYSETMRRLEDCGKQEPRVADIEQLVISSAKDLGFGNVAFEYESHRDRRSLMRELFSVSRSNGGDRDTTDAALLINSDSHDSTEPWDRERVIEALRAEANLSYGLAKDIAKKAETMIGGMVIDAGVRKLTTTQIRSVVDIALESEGLSAERKQQGLLGVPTKDLEGMIISKNQENSNIAVNNSEMLRETIADVILKQHALENIFNGDVADAHRQGIIHVHDLAYPERVYCSAHSLEYLKMFGLNKALPNLESKSKPANSAGVLNGHVQTFLASKQADYAGALGFGFVNILYSSMLNRPVDVVYGKLNGVEMNMEKGDLEKLVEQGAVSLEQGNNNYFEVTSERKELREVSQAEFDQIAQELIFSSSQNAFSRGGQTLFIDFNIHTGVPKYMRNVPVVGPSGKYVVKKQDGSVAKVDYVPRFENDQDPDDVRNGDADDSQLTGALEGGHIVTYGDLESTAQKFAKSMLDVWKKGDKDGRPFHFPKCDLHIDKNTFDNGKQEELMDYASQIASENGAVYFMFDRGDDAVLAQCCRLKEKIEDKSMLKHPEKLRFTGFQNVTVNLAQAAYRGKNLEGMLVEVDKAMDLALQAHLQKKEYTQMLLDTDGSPLRGAGRPCDDGSPYIDLEKATYIIGTIGLNEAVQALTGRQLHEGEDAYRLGLEVIAHMYGRIQEMKEKTGLKFTIEETPAESTTRRLAKVDMMSKDFGELAKKVIKGTGENPFYTNSIHFASGADVGLIDRIVGQSRFHDMIASGAMVHAWVGEARPDSGVIKSWVKNTLEKTRCSQFTVSPTYTECDECGTVMVGERELCKTADCSNSNPQTVNPETISAVTRIVGYNSRIKHWNGSQQAIYEERKRAEQFYAGGQGRDMSWLYNPDGHDKLTILQFGKTGCGTCENLEGNVKSIIEKEGLDVDYKVYHLDQHSREGLALAAMYDIPLDTVPSIVVAGREGYWKKTTVYAPKQVQQCNAGCGVPAPVQRSDLIRPREIREAIEKLRGDYGEEK